MRKTKKEAYSLSTGIPKENNKEILDVRLKAGPFTEEFFAMAPIAKKKIK